MGYRRCGLDPTGRLRREHQQVACLISLLSKRVLFGGSICASSGSIAVGLVLGSGSGSVTGGAVSGGSSLVRNLWLFGRGHGVRVLDVDVKDYDGEDTADKREKQSSALRVHPWASLSKKPGTYFGPRARRGIPVVKCGPPAHNRHRRACADGGPNVGYDAGPSGEAVPSIARAARQFRASTGSPKTRPARTIHNPQGYPGLRAPDLPPALHASNWMRV